MIRSSTSPNLVLASSSRYRQSLLAKLGLPFEAAAPAVDETPQPHETPTQLSHRLAIEKAKALATRYPAHLIIGSDQVAMLNGEQLNKPGNAERAIAQLQASSGQSVEFFTSVCVLNSASGEVHTELDRTVVHFRTLTERQIAAYVAKEQPFDCAGGFKSEGLGIVLFERIEGEDPNALIGLPLIRLVRLLEKFGVDILS
jgi:MAF protein